MYQKKEILHYRDNSHSLWKEEPLQTEFASIRSYTSLEADVCVIGAGIAGLTTAYFLTQEGCSVIVLDDGPIGGGETGQTTAHLSNALDDRYCELEKMYGPKGTALAASSHTKAIAMIEEIVQKEQIDCEFERLDGYLFPTKEGPVSFLKEELEAARRAGLNQVVWCEEPPVVWSPKKKTPCLRFPNQGQFHPLKYISGLAQAVLKRGGRIFTDAHVTSVKGGAPPELVVGKKLRIQAKSIVVATNSPINDRFAIQTKQAPYRTYVVGMRVKKGVIPKALYWDTKDPYHYVRLAQDPRNSEKEILVIGGEDHRTGEKVDAAKRFEALAKWAEKRFPKLGEVAFLWSGQVLEPADSLAYIGKDPQGQKNVYIATGDSGHGMTHGTIAGRLITDLIQKRKNPWASLYSPSRFKLKGLGSYLYENFYTGLRYMDWFKLGLGTREEDLRPGEGAVIQKGIKQVATYRDETGTLFRCSAVCTHLGGRVRFNELEKSWDCPCHGSRFAPDGTVLNGPANTPLKGIS